MQVGFWAALVSYVDRSFAAHLIMIGTLVCMGYRQRGVTVTFASTNSFTAHFHN